MKTPSKLTRWICSGMAAATLAGAASLCQAQAPAIVYNFTNSLQGWSGNNDNATYSWNATGGSTGGGCMQVVMDGVTSTEMDPWVTLPSTLNEAQYLSVTIHMMVDPNSGTTGTSGSGGYGNLQAVLRDASYSWDSIWHGAIYPPAANSWVTYTFIIAQPYKPAEKYLQFQLQQAGGTGYSAPVTNYIDNITISPLPNPWIIDAFTSDTSSGYYEENWTGVSETSSLNTSQDAGGGFTPLGALQVDLGFAAGSWQQSWVARAQAMDPSRFVYFECDVKVDAANSTPFSDGSYGALSIAVRDTPSWSGPYNCSPSSIKLDSSYTSWKHLKLALPTTGAGGNPITNSPAYDIIVNGTAEGPIRLYFDNMTVSKPVTRPAIVGLKPAGPGGLKIAVDADGTANQWDQEGIATPQNDNNANNFFWINQTPATYSFTLTNFPAPATAPGFDAHIYLINGDSITANGNVGSWGYNQTYSGVSWNALDYVGLHIRNAAGTNSGVVATFEWKTNSPSSDPPTNNQTQFPLPSLASANGTWTLTFSDNIHATLTGPTGSVGTVTLPNFLSDVNYANNFTPATSMVQFGLAKNDANNTGVNNNQSAIFTHVLVTNSVSSTFYDDTFAGPGLTGKYAWQITEYYMDGANRTAWAPYGTAYWLQWGVPSTGYTVRSAANLAGPWNDAGITYTYTDTSGTNIFGAIPTASLPVGNAAFFELINTNAP